MGKDLGDFQTPDELVGKVMQRLTANGDSWARLLEPTCGEGNFIRGALSLSHPPTEIRGLEIQNSYVHKARQKTKSFVGDLSIEQANFFDFDLRYLSWSTKSPLLVVGNPPWVTNSGLGSLGSLNSPRKSNFKKLRGLEAMTGSSNFDLTEYIWLRLITELADENPTIALLCKTSVARNVLKFASEANLPISNASIWKIDAKRWFKVAVDACLFRVDISSNERSYEAAVYEDIEGDIPISRVGIVNGELIANVEKYQSVLQFDGSSPLTWRQGVKHDASTVLELTESPDGMTNKLGELVQIESEYIHPLLKSSDIFNGTIYSASRAVIVTHKRLGENTAQLEHLAPQLWMYLNDHEKVFLKRKSSIYRNKPPFTMFGVGDYTFSKYKVAISGLHKKIRFRCIGPRRNKPVIFDDTCYFIPCSNAKEAAFVCSILNNALTLKFLESLIFWDSKRPVTKRLLQRMDLKSLFQNMNRDEVIAQAEREILNLEGSGSYTGEASFEGAEDILETEESSQHLQQLRLL